jgi:hypothetical protein
MGCTYMQWHKERKNRMPQADQSIPFPGPYACRVFVPARARMLSGMFLILGSQFGVELPSKVTVLMSAGAFNFVPQMVRTQLCAGFGLLECNYISLRFLFLI